jgi:hypothetical protein
MTEKHRAGLTGELPDLFDGDREKLIALATDMWRLRESMFPERVRRMRPDAIDMATGAWGICLREAMRQTDPKRWGDPEGAPPDKR